jgi:muconolactone delta-isomerase
MKFLALWSFHSFVRMGPEVAKTLMDLQDYAAQLRNSGKLERNYHIVGKHGGAWIFDVASNEELDRLIAMMPVYNFVNYEVFPLTEMGGGSA